MSWWAVVSARPGRRTRSIVTSLHAGRHPHHADAASEAAHPGVDHAKHRGSRARPKSSGRSPSSRPRGARAGRGRRPYTSPAAALNARPARLTAGRSRRPAGRYCFDYAQHKPRLRRRRPDGRVKDLIGTDPFATDSDWTRSRTTSRSPASSPAADLVRQPAADRHQPGRRLDAPEWNHRADTDGDGTPDLYDYDDDSDGVPDEVDISRTRAARRQRSGVITFTEASPSS